MKRGILSIDIGGTGLKAAVLDDRGAMRSERVKVATPHPCPPNVMVETLVELVHDLPAYDRISIGFPGVVRDDCVLTAPNLGSEDWSGFRLAAVLSKKLGAPAKLVNDAQMQGLALIKGKGLELVLTLGTGFGTALFRDGEVMPHMEIAHHPMRHDKTYEDFLGDTALKKAGKKRWNKRLRRAFGLLEIMLHPDTIILGGGNAANVDTDDLPKFVSIGSNIAGIQGGAALWKIMKHRRSVA